MKWVGLKLRKPPTRAFIHSLSIKNEPVKSCEHNKALAKGFCAETKGWALIFLMGERKSIRPLTKRFGPGIFQD
jgi:hypothetical protein